MIRFKLDSGVSGNVATNNAIAMAPVLASKGDALINAATRVKPIDGYYDFFVHGTPDSFAVLRNTAAPELESSWGYFDHRALERYVNDLPDYGGGPIRLISCKTAAQDATAAQYFANRMNVEVLAPTDTVWIHPTGKMTIGPTQFQNTGEWISIFPK